MSDSLTPHQRLALIDLVNNLPRPDFERLVFGLEAPQYLIPSNLAMQGDRSPALLKWVEGPTGCGLTEFIALLRKIAPDALQKALDSKPEQVEPQAVPPQQQSSNYYDFRGANFAGGFAETVHGDQIGGDQINVESPSTAVPQTPSESEILLPKRCLAPGAPFLAPPLPRHYVPRPEHLEVVKTELLDEAQPGTLVISAIYGMGGIGKSVLAAALVQESEVQQRFADGILWVTLGQQPDLLSMVNQW
ncbi:MAG: NB-ARC domain-containing protein, partial [Cyanobacteria bacterium P01_H01_bin.152]